MTHEELLAKWDNTPIDIGSATIVWKAIRAVVELHKPVEDSWMKSGFSCAGCNNRCGCYEGDMSSQNDWSTCPTIQAIEKELQ